MNSQYFQTPQRHTQIYSNSSSPSLLFSPDPPSTPPHVQAHSISLQKPSFSQKTTRYESPPQQQHSYFTNNQSKQVTFASNATEETNNETMLEQTSEPLMDYLRSPKYGSSLQEDEEASAPTKSVPLKLVTSPTKPTQRPSKQQSNFPSKSQQQIIQISPDANKEDENLSKKIVRLQGELNKRSVEMLNLNQKHLKLHQLFQKERETFGEQNRLKESVIQKQQTEIYDKEREIKNLTNQIQDLRSEILSYQQQVVLYLNQKDNLEREISKLKSAVSTQDLEKKEKEKSRVKDVIAEYAKMFEEQKQEYDTKINSLRSDVIVLEDQLSQKQKELDSLLEYKQQMDRIKLEQQQLIQTLKQSNTQNEEQLDHVIAECDTLKQENDNLKHQLEQYECMDLLVKELETEKNKSDQKSQELQKVNQQLLQEQSVMQQTLSKQTEEYENHARELRMLRDIVDDYKNNPVTQSKEDPKQEQAIHSLLYSLVLDVQTLNQTIISHVGKTTRNETVIPKQRQPTLQQMQHLRKEVDQLKSLISDYIADQLDSQCVTQ